MKNIFMLLCCLCASSALFAQWNLSGTVTDKKTGEKLQGAIVSIPEINRGVAVDADGKFQLKGLPQGSYLLNVSYIGYVTLSRPLVMHRDTSISIQLSQTAAELSNVVVTGISKATEVKVTPLAISLVGQKELQRTTATNIVDAISKLPGVSSINTGAAISKPVIRGLGYNRVLTLNDGFRQEGQQWGDEHGIEIDEASVGRVEILRGPGSLMYGGDAIAGVINFLPPPPPEEGKIDLNALVNYQSNNRMISSSLMTDGNIHGIHWRLRGSNVTAGNYRNAMDGVVWNSGFHEWNMNGRLGIDKPWGYSTLSFSTFNQQIGFNEGLRDSSGLFLHDIVLGDSVLTVSASGDDLNGYSIATPYQRVNHHRVSWQNKIFIKGGSLSVDASWQMNERREFSNPLQPDVAGLHFLMHTATLDLRYQLPEMKKWNTSVGIGSMYQNSKNKGTEFLIPDYQLFDYGLYAITRKKINKFLFEAGLRYDQRFYNSQSLFLNESGNPVSQQDSSATRLFTALQKDFWNFSGSIGFSYQANESWVFKLNASKGFRAPAASELASNGQHDGSFRYEYGNANLKPESSYQIDAGVNYTSEHLNFNVDVFENTIQHYIYVQKLSNSTGGDSVIQVSGGELIPAYQYRQNDAVLAGVEMTMDIHPHPVDWLHFENTFGYVYAVNLHQPDSAKYLPFTPPAHYRGELRFDIPKTGSWIRGLFAGLHFDYYFQQNHVLLADNTETPTPDYGLLGASAGFDFYVGGRKKIFSLIVAGENLLNTSYQSHLSRLKYLDVNPANGKRGIWNMGRNFSVKVIVPLQFSLKRKTL